MYDLILKGARLLDGGLRDLAIRDGRFVKIAPTIAEESREVFDCHGMAILPPFCNGHTHAAMVLLRGYADDLPLFPWLQEHIWPAEARLTAEDVVAGVRLAILEMIKSGTVFFNDSYFFLPETIAVVEEMGVRACIGLTCMDVGDAATRERRNAENRAIREAFLAGQYSRRVRVAYSPHAIYTVNEETLRQIAEDSARDGMLVHAHLAETEQEFSDCQKQHGGMTPFQYIEECGLLNDRARFAHCVWMTDEDREKASAAGAVLIHNPTSNLKLCSGVFQHSAAQKVGCRIALGTDGCASNNAHSLFSEMKVAALAGKMASKDPTVCPAETVFQWATKSMEYFVPDSGEIAEGKVADAMLLDLDQPYLVGDYHLISNLVYAGESSCVDSVLCDGKLLMKHRRVPGEEEILRDARRVCDKFRR